MIKLDENLLLELGLGSLPKPEKTAFLKHMYETLEMRVGTRLAERMSDQQMSEFEQYINSNDEQGAFHWLEANFPNYKQVVAEEFDKLKGEIQPLASQIVAASQAQAAQGGVAGGASESLPADTQQQQYAPQTPAPPQDMYTSPQQFQQSAGQTDQQSPSYGPAPASPSPSFGQQGSAAPSFNAGPSQYQPQPTPAYQPAQPQQSYYDAPQAPAAQPTTPQQYNGSYQQPASQQPSPYAAPQPPAAADNSDNSQSSFGQQQYQQSAPATAPQPTMYAAPDPSSASSDQNPNPFGPAPQFGPAPSSPPPQTPTYGQPSQPAPSPFGQQPPQPGQ